MTVISVINQKGGVGKSTVSVNLSYGLAGRGLKTLLIDLDPQAHSSAIYARETGYPTIREVVIDAKLPLKKAIRQGVVQGTPVTELSIVPSNVSLADIPEMVAGRIHREKILHKKIRPIKKQYDFIIIDNPPSLGILTINAIYAADRILIPTAYSRYSLDGISDLLDTISEIWEERPFEFKILRNMYDGRIRTTNEFVERQLEPYQVHVLKTIIRKTESINQASIIDRTIYQFEGRSRGVEDFEHLAGEVIDLWAN